jgi:hypothetical protein
MKQAIAECRVESSRDGGSVFEENRTVSELHMREMHFFDQNVLLQEEMMNFVSPRESLASSVTSSEKEGTTTGSVSS